MHSEKELDELLGFANRTVDKSRKLLLEYLQRGFTSELKPDKSVVTEADKAAEALIRKEIERELPGHSIVGEEMGGAAGEADYQWIIDPIDGTANFLTGIPTFGTIFALFHKGEPVVGVSDHPALGWRFTAKKGGGVFRDGTRLKVRGLSKGTLSPQENVGISSRIFFEYSAEGERFDAFVKAHPNIRIYRDVFAHGLVASGALGAMVEFNSMIWDLAVAKLFTEEAGGTYLQFPARGAAAGEERLNAIFGAAETVELLKRFFIV